MRDKIATNYLRTYLDRHPTKVYKKGDIIIFQGEAPRHAYVIKSGIVKAYNLSVNGDEKPVGFYGELVTFPDAWVYGKLPNAIYYFEAFTPEVELYCVDRDELAKFIKTRPELLNAELDQLLMNKLAMSMRLNALQHSKASDKLLYTLHYLALSHGKEVGPKQVEITLDLTHQDFANLTGLTRETAATELNKLKRSEVISYGKNIPYKLNLAKLTQMLNDQYIADLPSAL